MSHITCPKCGSNEHISGYGFAAGPLGGYTICVCGVVLELYPDIDDMPEEYVAKIERIVEEWRKEVWPNGKPNQPGVEKG